MCNECRITGLCGTWKMHCKSWTMVVDFVFFVVGVVRTYSFLTELKKSEYAVKLFVHIAIAKGLINHGM